MLLLFFRRFLKLILFLEDLDELVRTELINGLFCYQSLLPGNHFLPKEAATKYQGIFSFATILEDKFVTKSYKEGFFIESLRANFN